MCCSTPSACSATRWHSGWLHPDAAGIAGPWERAAFVAGAAFLLGWISGIDVGVNFHDHTHRRIFTREWLNRWGARLWTFSGGWPALCWQYAHVTVHHANLLEERDWTLPRRGGDGRFENIYVYLLCHWPWRYARHMWRDIRAGHLDGGRARPELLWFLLFWSIPFLIDPWMGVWLWLLPHWLANCVTMGSGMYVQHAGCIAQTTAEPARHSNSFLSPFFNRTMFHIGYHVEHHDHPGVHWADLPEFHRRHRDELIEAGAHFVPCGYYGAARQLSSVLAPAAALRRFECEQARGYERQQRAESA
ncbi:MAG: fatty acid desaturase [Planctomycetota bacterium]